MEKPSLILSAIPIESSDLENIFEFGKNSIKDLLEKPGQLRFAGWDLNTLDATRIVEGKYLEVKNGERKLIKLYEDGTLILSVAADETFLGWGQHEGPFKDDPKLNSLAITELTYNFIDFYKKLISRFTSKPNKISFKIKIENAFFNDSKLYLVPYELDTFGWISPFEKYKAQKKDMEDNFLCNPDELITSPTHIAYLALEKIYLWFGVSKDKIPYTFTDKLREKHIDIEKIKNQK